MSPEDMMELRWDDVVNGPGLIQAKARLKVRRDGREEHMRGGVVCQSAATGGLGVHGANAEESVPPLPAAMLPSSQQLIPYEVHCHISAHAHSAVSPHPPSC